MNIRTRKLILALFFFSGAVSPGMCGVNLGMTGAVKNKVKELDKKVRDKAAASLLVGGTAATGQPIMNAPVSLRACNGTVLISTTAADGRFEFSAASFSFPLLLRVTSGTSYYYSIADAAGTSNVHPLTDLVVRSYFRSARGVADADAAYAANSASICAPDISVLAPMKLLMNDILSPVLVRNTVDPDTLDLFKTPFSANGAGFDRVLDETLVVANTGFSTVTVRDTVGNVILSTIATGVNDNAVPAAPTNLTTAAVSHSSITLVWALSVSTNVAGYEILRNGSRIAVSSAGVYADLGVTPGVQYAYAVKAFTWTGKYSAPTPVKSVTALGYLTVTKTGSGTGAVISAPAGIQCGSSCSSEFTAGTQVTLTAIPEIGSAFAGWSGGSCSGTGTCVVTLGGAAISARFVSASLLCVNSSAGGGGFSSVPPGIYCRQMRQYHAAALLPTGNVMVVGGESLIAPSYLLGTADIYDPSSEAWFMTSAMSVARIAHRAVVLPNGRVLVMGGISSAGAYYSSAELYDPLSGTWSVTGTMTVARANHTATLLPSGKVLVTGGMEGSASAELYDSVSATWSLTGAMSVWRYGHTATLLPNGKVLVVGGRTSGSNPVLSAELYDPVSGTWTGTGSMSIRRANHTATLLPNGRVLVAAGNEGTGLLSSAEVYDPATGTWSMTGSLSAVRWGHNATLINNGKVLVDGGGNNSSTLLSAELYDPSIGTWSMTGSLSFARMAHTSTLLPNGKVLAVGGTLLLSDLYNPASGSWSAVGHECAGYFPSGSGVTLIPVASAGFKFYEWIGGVCSGSGNCNLTANTLKIATGTFRTANTLTVAGTGSGLGTLTTASGGINCGGTCSESYFTNTIATLTASAASGSVFAGWSGGGCSGSNPVCYITMDADKTVVATFAASYSLTVSKVGSGTVTSSPSGITCGATCSATFAGGTSVTITAAPAAGYYFAGWGGSYCTGAGDCTVTMDIAKSVSATFNVNPPAGTVTTLATSLYVNIGALAVDSNNVYWTEAIQGDTWNTGVTRVKKVGLNGGAVTTIAQITNQENYVGTTSMAVDANGVYWLQSNGSVGGTTIKKVGLNGGTITTLVTSGSFSPSVLALYAGNLYYTDIGNGLTNSGLVRKIGTNGGSVTNIASGLGEPWSIVANATGIYWNSTWNTKIMKTGLNGGGTTILAQMSFPADDYDTQIIAADSNYVYYVDNSASTINKVSVNGGTPVVISNTSGGGITTDSTDVYWTGINYVYKYNKASGAVTHNGTGGTNIAVDSANVYWVDGDMIKKTAKW